MEGLIFFCVLAAAAYIIYRLTGRLRYMAVSIVALCIVGFSAIGTQYMPLAILALIGAGSEAFMIRKEI